MLCFVCLQINIPSNFQNTILSHFKSANFSFGAQFHKCYPSKDFSMYFQQNIDSIIHVDAFFIICLIKITANILQKPIIILNSHPDVCPSIALPNNNCKYSKSLIIAALYHSHQFLSVQCSSNKISNNNANNKQSKKRKRNSLGEYETGNQWLDRHALYAPKTYGQVKYLLGTIKLMINEGFLSNHSNFNHKQITNIIIFSLETHFKQKICMSHFFFVFYQ